MIRRAVFPGAFDPIHYGHIDIARRALAIFDELIIGVYDRPLKNLLFTPEERVKMVQRAFIDETRVIITPYDTLTVAFAHQIGACAIVRGLRVFSDFEHEFRMALANKRLDPSIEVIALITSEKHTFLSSSTVKEIATLGGDVSSMVPNFVAQALQNKLTGQGEITHKIEFNPTRD